MRLVYFGSGAFGLPTLQSLADRHEVALVVTQPDRPAGRGGALTPTPASAWARGRSPPIPVITPDRANDPAVVGRVHDGRPDAIVVIAFGQKLGPAVLAGVPAINLHASLLPRWRGAAPINHAILAGDDRSGVSVITLAVRMDAGDVLAATELTIDPRETAGELHDRLSELGPAAVGRVLDDLAAGRARATPQDEALVTLAPKLSRADGWVDFAAGAESCRRRIHGLTPWPGVAVKLGEDPVKLLRAIATAPGADGTTDADPGTIIEARRGLIACGGRTVLELVEVQPAGGRPMAWADFSRGRRVKEGDRLIGGTPSC